MKYMYLAYPGATPEEVEQGCCAIEEATRVLRGSQTR